MEVFFMNFKMVRQIVDLLCEQSDLHNGGSGIFGVNLEVIDNFCLFFFQ